MGSTSHPPRGLRGPINTPQDCFCMTHSSSLAEGDCLIHTTHGWNNADRPGCKSQISLICIFCTKMSCKHHKNPCFCPANHSVIVPTLTAIPVVIQPPVFEGSRLLWISLVRTLIPVAVGLMIKCQECCFKRHFLTHKSLKT